MTPSTGEQSPIFEIFQIAALSGFPIGIPDKPKKLIIISDMLIGARSGLWTEKIDGGVIDETHVARRIRNDEGVGQSLESGLGQTVIRRLTGAGRFGSLAFTHERSQTQ